MPSDIKIADLGLRERNKRDKLLRIKSAALKLFIEKGFEHATIRQISKRAGVAFGTVFLYASNKRDLLFLIYIDDLEELADKAFLDIDPDAPFIDQLLTVFEKFYKFFAERPELARDVLREMNFFEEGSQAVRFHSSIRRIESQMAKLVVQCRSRGMINTDADTKVIATLLFGIYRAEVRRWLGRADLSVKRGLKRLKPQLEIVINGLDPASSALGRTKVTAKSRKMRLTQRV